MKQSVLYFIASAMFGLAAVINVVSDGEIGLRILLYLIAGAAFYWLGLKSRRGGA
jgi:hypothetical protein